MGAFAPYPLTGGFTGTGRTATAATLGDWVTATSSSA